MSVSDVFVKIELEYDPEERPERIADEICRQLKKFYGVREAEVSSVTLREE
jgi:hypothetical protein